jgi:hypothetical protein
MRAKQRRVNSCWRAFLLARRLIKQRPMPEVRPKWTIGEDFKGFLQRFTISNRGYDIPGDAYDIRSLYRLLTRDDPELSCAKRWTGSRKLGYAGPPASYPGGRKRVRRPTLRHHTCTYMPASMHVDADGCGRDGSALLL